LARHHTAFDRLLDLKPRAFAACDALLGWHPALRRASGFFPDFGWPAARARIISDETRRNRLLDARYAQAREIVSQYSVDVMNPFESGCGPDETRMTVALIEDAIIPGHTLTPADPETGQQIALTQRCKARWAFAYPALARKTIPIRELCLAIPPFLHYSHVLTDVLMPIAEAVRIGAIPPGEELVVVTGSHPPIVDAFIDGLSGFGIRARQLQLRPGEQVRADRYLYARTHSLSVERLLGPPDAHETALKIFRNAYGDRASGGTAKRLYMKRVGHRQRVVAGEDELVARLEAAGFTILVPEWSNHAEQIKSCAAADVIVAMHGAALCNIVFSRPDTTLVEIMASDARKTVGLHWAAESGARYVPLLGSPEGKKQSFSIDPAEMARAVIAAAEQAQTQSGV